MTTRTQQKTAYKKANYKRVPLERRPNDYERLRAAADADGMSVNGWIKSLIEERLEAYTLNDDDDDELI